MGPNHLTASVHMLGRELLWLGPGEMDKTKSRANFTTWRVSWLQLHCLLPIITTAVSLSLLFNTWQVESLFRLCGHPIYPQPALISKLLHFFGCSWWIHTLPVSSTSLGAASILHALDEYIPFLPYKTLVLGCLGVCCSVLCWCRSALSLSSW